MFNQIVSYSSDNKRVFRRNNKGFTIIEVMIAFSILLVILAGTVTAVTASMRLNVVEKERGLAQDVVRDVVSSYIKSVPFDDPASNNGDIYPYDDATLATTPLVKTLYDNNAPTTYYTNNLSSTLQARLGADLSKLDNPKLELIFSPIKRSSTQFFTTKINVITRLTWQGSRIVEVPTVVGQGDITRAQRSQFIDPAPLPTPTSGCIALGLIPPNPSACCSNLIYDTTSGTCITAPSGVCSTQGQNPVTTGKACCTSPTVLLPHYSTGLCEPAPSCTPLGIAKTATGGAACCPGSQDVSGTCVVAPTGCVGSGTITNGTAISASQKSNCCSGAVLTHKDGSQWYCGTHAQH